MQQASDWSQLAATILRFVWLQRLSPTNTEDIRCQRRAKHLPSERADTHSEEAKRYRDVPHHEYEVAKPPLD